MSFVSKVVIGTWPLSGDFGNQKLAEIENTLVSAYENGFTEFDVAPNYGQGFMELALGKTFFGVNDITINTKMGNHPFHGKSFAVDVLRKSIDCSLERLGRDKIGTLFLHNPRDEVTSFSKLFKLFDELKKEGMIEKSGLSLARGYAYPKEVLTSFDVIQNDANLLYLGFDQYPLVKGQIFMARSPLASGILGGHIRRDSTFSKEDHRAGWLRGDRLVSLVRRVEAIESEFKNERIDSIARQFLFAHPQIDRIIYGVKTPKHITQIKFDCDGPGLSRSDFEKILSMYLKDFGLKDQRHLGF